MSAATRALLATILIAGCATGQPAISVPAERLAEVTARCESIVGSDDGLGAVRSAFEHAGLIGLYLALRGAAEGAWWGAVTGSSAAEGAWIGAAAGAGLGMIIGVGVGIHRGLDAHRTYRAAYETCVAAPPPEVSLGPEFVTSGMLSIPSGTARHSRRPAWTCRAARSSRPASP